MICQRIEDSLVERLAYGWEEPVFYLGEQVGSKRKFDNSAAIAYLDRHDPDFIAGKKQNVDVTSNGETVGVDVGVSVERLAASDPGYLAYRQQQLLKGQGD